MLKIIPKTIKYYDLFPLLKILEKERPGIKDRVWKFLCEEKISYNLCQLEVEF